MRTTYPINLHSGRDLDWHSTLNYVYSVIEKWNVKMLAKNGLSLFFHVVVFALGKNVLSWLIGNIDIRSNLFQRILETHSFSQSRCKVVSHTLYNQFK